jgi:peptidoglycan/xylan/chitin deacetylase (PgdA/CDA1 family)
MSQANIVWPKLTNAVQTVMTRIQPRFEKIQRRRRNGSIIRVFADLLPDFCFSPTPRIFIANHDVAKSLNTRGTDGMIVAFEFDDGESEGTELVDDGITDEEQDVSSNPEGWMDTFPLFQPG